MATTNTGTRQMRSNVTMFAGVQSRSCAAPFGVIASLPFHFVEQRVGYDDAADISRFACSEVRDAVNFGSLAHSASEQ